MQSSNDGKYYRRKRKLELVKKGLVSCKFCGFHKNENAPLHNEKPDNYKNKNRQTIRLFDVEMVDNNMKEIFESGKIGL